jgi:hypothetical protein
MSIRMVCKTLIIGSSLFIASVASAQNGANTSAGVNRVCSVRPAAALIAQALATKIKAQMDAGAAAAKRSTASVRVTFSPPKSRPAAVKVDMAKDVTVNINLAATGDKVALQGVPSAATLYQTCDPGKINFTIAITYRDFSKDKASQVNLRQTLEVSLPGQFL